MTGFPTVQMSETPNGVWWGYAALSYIQRELLYMLSWQHFCFEAYTIVCDANIVTFKSLKCFAVRF